MNNNTLNEIDKSSEIYLYITNRDNFSKKASIVWLYIYSSMNKTGYNRIYVSIARMADEVGLSISSVQRGLRELLAKKFIHSASILGNSKKWAINYYTCLYPPAAMGDEFPFKRTKSYNYFSPTPDSFDDLMSANDEYTKMCFPEKEKPSSPVPNPDLLKENLSNLYTIHSIRIVENCEISYQSDKESFLSQIVQNQTLLDRLFLEQQKITVEISENAKLPFCASTSLQLLNRNSQIGSYRKVIEDETKFLSKKLAEMNRVEKQTELVMKNEEYLSNLSGKRPVSEGLAWWVKKKLHAMGIQKDAMALKINEIFHAVRFGSLSHTKYNFHEEMPIMKSINIALKLVKEGRWQSPASFLYGGADYAKC